MVAALNKYKNPFTSHAYRTHAARIFRELTEDYGAKPLARKIPRSAAPRPRNTTATEEDRRRILAAAPPYVLLFTMLCSDMAIRSGTAIRLGPNEYDRARGELTFTTKYGAKQTLPVTASIALLLNECSDASLPFVAQLGRYRHWRSGRWAAPLGHISVKGMRRAFSKVTKAVGITRQITPHDLRRTTAARVYNLTKDLRLVQALLGHRHLTSTLWYLDHTATPVDVSTLELAKLNPTTEAIQ